MSKTQEPPLLWINKDASNVHRKKHVAEVNAHVQKSGLKKRRPKKPSSYKKQILPLHKLSDSESHLTSPGSSSNISTVGSDSNTIGLRNSDDSFSAFRAVSSDGGASPSSDFREQQAAALIFSSYLEEGVLAPADNVAVEAQDLSPEFELLGLDRTDAASLPRSLDASSPLPGFLPDLSPHDRMLIHTHLTYMPQMYFGLTNEAIYCPIRTSSVANMIKAPVGVLWVLISLDMFLETMRGSSARKLAILQRKNHAYQLMAKALEDGSKSNDPSVLLGPASAAIAEMFCGDPARALTHLNGIDAFIEERGGLKYVEQMELTISMPVFAISAYRTILQDNLRTGACFERARTSFMSTMHSLLTWNTEVTNNLALHSSETHPKPIQDEGFDGDYDLLEGVLALQMVRERAFIHHPLLRKFVGPEYETDKPGEKVDHFIVLYNLNRILADCGTRVRHATGFIAAIVNDVETGGSTRGADSSIKISGVLRLITNRQAKMYTEKPSSGILRAWEALDALEIMKLLSVDTQRLVHLTLHSLLCGDTASAMTREELNALESNMVAEWQKRHPSFLTSTS